VASGGGLTIDTSEIEGNVKALPAFIDKAVAASMKYNEGGAENWLKANAPWSDQTSNARNGLAARYAGSGGGVHTMVLYHQMPYGIWLEVRWDGKYAVILPGVQQTGPKVMHTLQGILDAFPGMGI
jgi:hypothetical protein